MIDWLKQRLVDIVQWFSDLFVAGFTALWDFVKDACCWGFEQLIGIVVSAAGSLDVSGLAGYASAWGNVPAEVLNVMGLLGFGTAASIIMSAVAIRLVLQLIPFTRLGS